MTEEVHIIQDWSSIINTNNHRFLLARCYRLQIKVCRQRADLQPAKKGAVVEQHLIETFMAILVQLVSSA